MTHYYHKLQYNRMILRVRTPYSVHIVVDALHHTVTIVYSMHVCIALILHSTVEPMYAFRYYHAYVSIE